ALGKHDAARNLGLRQSLALEHHLRQVPEDARAHILLAALYAARGRTEDAVREAQFAVSLRPNDATLLYNVACTYGQMNRKQEALDAIKKAWEAGFTDANWARRDPDLAILRGDPEFERLYPETPTGN
ncbi:MAG TPA: hypothetical protein VLE48_15190, partial [Terriglobales bacterium]|nr:hypothetical protein [Terriglobales bacterium]